MNFQLPEELKKLKLTVKILNGDLTFKKAEGDELVLEFPGLVKTNIEEFFEIKFEENHLFLREKARNELSDLFKSHKYPTDVIINIPENISIIELLLNSINGDIDIKNFNISGSIKTTNGDIDIRHSVLNTENISTINGDIKINDSKGTFIISVVNGDIQISDSEINKIQVKTQNGDILIKSNFKLDEDGIIKTNFGDIKINFNTYESDKNLIINSVAGDAYLEGEFDSNKVKIKKFYFNFSMLNNLDEYIKNIFDSISKSFANAGITVDFKNKNNNLKNTNSKKEKTEAINKVLDMLDKGKITPDQAKELIEQINNK